MISISVCSCPVTSDVESVKSFSVDIYDSIDEVPQVLWDKHVPEANFLMKYEELKLIELIHKNSIQFRYAIISREGHTVGVLYYQIVMFHANQLINYFPEVSGNFVLKGVKSFTQNLLDRVNLKLLVSGNVFMTGENGFYFSSEVDKPTRAKILRKVALDILKTDKSIKAILVSDLYKPKTAFDTDFKRCGYNEIHVESDMSLQLKDEWKSFDDYLNSLTSKYRVRAKRVFTLCENNEVIHRELDANEIREQEDRLLDLYHKVMSQADFKLAELGTGFFSAQKELFPDNYHVYAYYRSGQMIGFISAFWFGKKMEVHYTGMDAEICRPIHLYQHMMYDMVKLGIEKRVERLHFGRTAPEIKSTIGAVPSPMYGYLKHRNPLFNFFIARPYTANLKPKDYIFRNPFKG